MDTITTDEERILRVWTPIILRTILVGAVVIHGLGLESEAAAVESAVERALAGGLRTPDLGGAAGTEQATRTVLENVK